MNAGNRNMVQIITSFLLGALLIFAIWVPQTSLAFSAGIPFGGRVVSPTIALCGLFVPVPAVIVYDFVTKIPIGLLLPPLDPKLNQVYKPGNATLGLYNPTPTGCFTLGPVPGLPAFTIILNGTSVLPAF